MKNIKNHLLPTLINQWFVNQSEQTIESFITDYELTQDEIFELMFSFKQWILKNKNEFKNETDFS
jgi:translation elongation factor EF-Ts